MPIMFTTPDGWGRRSDPPSTLTAWGECSDCGRGSCEDPRYAVILWAADCDGQPPWICEYCFEGRHDRMPDMDAPGDCGFDIEMVAPRFDTMETANANFTVQATAQAIARATAQIAVQEETNMPTPASNLRADRVVESYDFENDYLPPQPHLMLPALSDRDARLVSVEQEIGKGREYIASAFFSGGFSLHDYASGYHSGDDGGFCRVEDDASVNAEIIYGKLRLSDPAVAQRFEDALCVVRDAITEGEVKLDMRCGLHVHVDAKGLGMREITNLYNLWNHVEDTVYRLGSANWRCHRTAVANTNYAPPTMKGLEGHAAIGEFFNGSRGALNLSNYLASRSRCHCGAFAYAAWEDCTCDLPKATVEFRVFNATANIRKVHAYTALSLGMVEAARRLTITPDDFPVHAFDRRHAETLRDTDATKKALEVIFGGMIPLTDSEREDLSYCARNSSVAEVFATM